MSFTQFMHNNVLKALTTLPILGMICLIQAPAQANSWQYARDAVGDSLDLDAGRSFDIFGMGIHDDGQNITVGISSNLGLDGYAIPGNQVCVGGRCYPVTNGNIGFGDLFFDFTGNREFGTSNDNRQLLGIRFSPSNDSKVGVGVYSNVHGIGVQTENAGYRNLGRYYNSLPTRSQQETMNVGNLAWNDSYWGGNGGRYTYSGNTESMPNVIESGDRIGDVTLLDRNALASVGFDQGMGGSHIFGFQFSKSLFPNGNFIASLFEECLNDAIALRGSFVAPPSPPVLPVIEPDPEDPVITKVPEPSVMLGFALAGVSIIRKGRKKLFN